MEQVSAIIVTRGDVPYRPVLESLPEAWEKIVWDNEGGECRLRRAAEDGKFYDDYSVKLADVENLAVYGRYAAIEYATHDVIYVQDDDVIVSDPQAVVAPLVHDMYRGWGPNNGVAPFLVDLPVVCNMPPEFRHDFYTDHALVGFGAAFHRSAPERAFDRWWKFDFPVMRGEDSSFNRTCDIVFTGLSRRVLVDVPIEHMWYATADNRMYRQKTHIKERSRMRELVRQVSA